MSWSRPFERVTASSRRRARTETSRIGSSTRNAIVALPPDSSDWREREREDAGRGFIPYFRNVSLQSRRANGSYTTAAQCCRCAPQAATVARGLAYASPRNRHAITKDSHLRGARYRGKRQKPLGGSISQSRCTPGHTATTATHARSFLAHAGAQP